jgi:hypothetical protein
LRATARWKRDEPSMPDVAAEVIRRVTDAGGLALPDGSRRGPYVVRLSDPPTPRERLQLAATCAAEVRHRRRMADALWVSKSLLRQHNFWQP